MPGLNITPCSTMFPGTRQHFCEMVVLPADTNTASTAVLVNDRKQEAQNGKQPLRLPKHGSVAVSGKSSMLDT